MANHHKTDKHQDKPATPSTQLHVPHSVADASEEIRATVLPAVVHFTLDVIDRGQATALGALHDARIELRVAVDGSLELADKASAAALRFARKLVQRADDLASETLGGAERVLTHTVAGARSSVLAAAERITTRLPQPATLAAAPAPAAQA